MFPTISHYELKPNRDYKVMFDKPYNMNKHINVYENSKYGKLYDNFINMQSHSVQSLFESHFCYHNSKFLNDLFPSGQRLERLRQIPCTIIHGEQDKMCLPKFSQKIKNYIPSVRFRLIPNASHSIFDKNIIPEVISAIKEMEKYVDIHHINENQKIINQNIHFNIPDPIMKKRYR